MIQRRGFLAGLGALLAAPAIIRTPGLLMPVRPVLEPVLVGVDWGMTPSRTERWVYMSNPGAQYRPFMYDWFMHVAAANGAVVERLVADGAIAGRSADIVFMDEADEATSCVHAIPSRERDDDTERSRDEVRWEYFGDWTAKS